MADIVRMGVVGAGAIALRGILPHLSQADVQDRVRLQAVCDPVPGRAAAAAEKYGVARAFTTYEELLEAGDVDAVTIASPIGLHYEQGRQALLAGKHIHFNKTMTTTVAEATELIDVGQRSWAQDRRFAWRGAAPAEPAGQEADRRGSDRAALLGGVRRSLRPLPRAGGVPQRRRRAFQRRPVLVLPQAGRRAALRYDRLRAPRPDQHPRAGAARDGAFRHAHQGARVPRPASSRPTPTTTR